VFFKFLLFPELFNNLQQKQYDMHTNIKREDYVERKRRKKLKKNAKKKKEEASEEEYIKNEEEEYKADSP